MTNTLAKACVVIGGGGHAKVLVDILTSMSDVQVLGYTDVKQRNLTIPYLGNDTCLFAYLINEIFLVNGIGSVSFPRQRKEIFEMFKKKGYRFYSITHSRAIIASDVKLAEGVQVMAGAIINSSSSIGENVIINTAASIDHDCQIGAHTHVAPGATLSGRVTIGENCHVGTGATIIQNITIGHGTVIGAGSVVIKDIPPEVVAVGNPAKYER